MALAAALARDPLLKETQAFFLGKHLALWSVAKP